MNMIRNKIMSAAIICLLSSSAYSASNTYDSEYTPGSSGRSLFKTALVGLAMMTMPKTVEAQKGPCCVTDPAPAIITGFYIGEIDEENITPSNNLTINKIINTSCNFNYNYNSNKLIDIPLKFSGDFNSYAFNENTLDVSVRGAYLCSMKFSGGPLPIRIKLNYDENNTFEYFSMITYQPKYPLINYIMPPPCRFVPCPQPIPTRFDDVFNHVLDTSSCPPLPTLWPTPSTPTSVPTAPQPTGPTTLFPTPAPTTDAPTKPPSPTLEPTPKPSTKPTTNEPTTEMPTTSDPTRRPSTIPTVDPTTSQPTPTILPTISPTPMTPTLAPTPRSIPTHYKPTHRPWPTYRPFWPTIWGTQKNNISTK